MSLYGGLYAGVSGLRSQSNKIGIISDNIANVNTIGYKAGSAQFETLVTSSGTNTYSPGGALGGNRQLVDKQGLIQTTDAPTDVAIVGKGFFAVNTEADLSGDSVFTRAGSFRQDNLGNFVNAAGFYLQGWPLDREGRLPGEPGNINTTSSANLDSLETVNVNQASGVAAATTTVAIGANLNAAQAVFPGESGDITMDILSPANYGIAADAIIVPASPYGAATTNNIARGDRFTVSTGTGLSYTYRYGGFAIGRDVTVSGAANVGDGGVSLAPVALGANPLATVIATNVVTITTAAPHGFATGDRVTLAGIVGPQNGIPASELNGQHVITVTGANTYTFTTTTAATATGSPAIGAGTVTNTNRLFAGNILDATTSTTAFLATTGTSLFTTAARSFTITGATAGTVTFTYVASSPNSLLGQFNNLNNLANAINDVNGFTARIVGGRLHVSAEDANESLTFANGDTVGSAGPPQLFGINWVQELDLANVAAGTGRFNTLSGLEKLADTDIGITGTVTNPLSNARLSINVDDPLDTIQFQDYSGTSVTLGNDPFVSTAGPAPVTITVTDTGAHAVGDSVLIAGAAGFDNILASEINGIRTITSVVPGVSYTFVINPVGSPVGGVPGGGAAVTQADSNAGSLLAELGLVPSLNGGATVLGNTGVLGPAYDSSGAVGGNMASGDITAQFSRNVRIYDGLGTGHDIRFSLIKIGVNTWAAEIHAIPETDVNTPLVDGQIAVGTISFNGDGSLRSASSSLINPVTINWTNGAVPSTVSFNLGTAGQPFGTPGATAIGLTDGLSQFTADYNVQFVDQNGAPVGQLTGVNIDENGYVIASYNNGETQRLYQLPVVDFNNPNGLRSLTGNVFAQTRDSGEINLRIAGSNGVGSVQSGALEQSNVDLAEELTSMIIAQRAYQANTRVIKTTDELLNELNSI